MNRLYINKSNSRIKSFDVLKLFTIFCVLIGHCILHLQNYKFDCYENPFYRFIISFHMPLFMTISGFFVSKTLGIKRQDFIKKKFRQLIIPSLVFGVLFCISWTYAQNGGGIHLITDYIFCYWFLKSAFICSCLYFIVSKFSQQALAIVISLLISQFIFSYQVSYMYPCFLIGVLINCHYNWFTLNIKTILTVSSMIFLSMFVYWTADMASSSIPRIYEIVQINSKSLVDLLFNHVFRILIGISGSIMFLGIFIYGARFIPSSRIGDLLCKYGQYTLGIYLLQAIIIEHIMMKNLDFSDMSFEIFNFLISPLLSVIVLMICICIIKFIHKFPKVSFLMLGQ